MAIDLVLHALVLQYWNIIFILCVVSGVCFDDGDSSVRGGLGYCSRVR